MFCEKGVLSNFAKFKGKRLCQGLFFNKVAGLRPQAWNFIKKETLAQVFSCEFCKIFKNIFSYRTPLVAASVCVRLWLSKFLFFKSQMIYFIRCKADVYLAMSLITKSECLKGIFLPLRSWMKCVKIWHGWNFLVMQSTFPWNIASNTLIFTSFPICHIYHYAKYVRIRVFLDPYNPVYRKI